MRYVSLPGAPARTLTAESPGFRCASPLQAKASRGRRVGAIPTAHRPGCRWQMETPAGSLRTGPGNGLIDVAGLQVGHAYRHGEGWLTGTTVIVTSAAGAVAGVDVPGGGPGTRGTDLLDPRNSAEPVHAIVRGGGSTYGPAAADRNAGTHDTVGPGGPSSPMLFHQMLAVAADCFTRAIVHAVLSAASVGTPAGNWPAYLDVFGSADRR